MFDTFLTINEIETLLKDRFNKNYKLVQTEHLSDIPPEHTVGLFLVQTPENIPFFKKDYVIEQIELNKHIFIELCWVNNILKEGHNIFKMVNPMSWNIEINRKKHLFEIIKIY